MSVSAEVVQYASKLASSMLRFLQSNHRLEDFFMQRLFSVNQAQHALEAIESHITALEEALESSKNLQVTLREHPPRNPVEIQALTQELRFVESQARQAHEALEASGVIIRDLASGIVEFPSRIGGEVVHLVWKRGDPSITHYHRLLGDDTPRPIGPQSGNAASVAPGNRA